VRKVAGRVANGTIEEGLDVSCPTSAGGWGCASIEDCALSEDRSR
jgi:hypothetical protein